MPGTLGWANGSIVCPRVTYDTRVNGGQQETLPTLRITYQFREECNHPKPIGDEALTRQQLNYIHHNPVKRGYVDIPEHWRYSRVRNYLGEEGLIEVNRMW